MSKNLKLNLCRVSKHGLAGRHRTKLTTTTNVIKKELYPNHCPIFSADNFKYCTSHLFQIRSEINWSDNRMDNEYFM